MVMSDVGRKGKEVVKSVAGHDRASESANKSYPFFMGGLAACIAAAFTHPLDCAKYRMQTGPSHSMFQTLIKAIQTEGIRQGAFAGLSASFLRQLTYSVTRFGVYDSLKRVIARRSLTARGDVAKLSAFQMAQAASVAGAMGGFAGNPADVVLVRMAGDLNKPLDKRLGYRHAIDGVMRIVREEGSTSLFRGLGPNLTRAILMNASQLASYDTFKLSLLKTGYFHDGLALHFTASSLAGAVATTICSPFDVLKSRIMNQGQNGVTAGMIIRESFQKEGVRWLFRGWVPAFVRLGPNTVIIFLSLEQLKKLWDVALNR